MQRWLKQCSWEIWRERGLANKFHNQFNSAIETMVVANNLFNWSLASSRLSSPSPRINRRAPYEDDSATYKVQLWKPSYNDQNQNDPPHQHWGVHVAFPLKLSHIEAENSFVSLRKSQSYSITITIFPPVQNHHLPHLLLQNAHVLVTELPLLSPKQFNSKVLDSCYMLLLTFLFQKDGGSTAL